MHWAGTSWVNNAPCSHTQVRYNGPARPLKSVHSRRGGGYIPYLVHGSYDPTKSAPKQHLNRFSHFRTAHPHVQHTITDRDTQTRRPRYV